MLDLMPSGPSLPTILPAHRHAQMHLEFGRNSGCDLLLSPHPEIERFGEARSGQAEKKMK